MKLLHTSDWHLGAVLAGHDRLAEQKLFLHWLVDLAVEHQVHALLIAGDVYDTANPPIAAQRLFGWFLVEMKRRLPDCVVVAIAGNHDSGARLEAPRPFTEALGNLHLIGSAQQHGTDCLLTLPGSDGSPAAWCLAVPFLRPADVDCRVQDGESPEAAFSRAVKVFYTALREQARRLNPDLPVIAMGHCTVAGSERASSERLLIGGVESLPVTAIAEGCDYVAMGHIHRAQRVSSDHIRYCGSPYPMDCDERRYHHQVLLVCVNAGSAALVEPVTVPSPVPFLHFPQSAGDWEETRSQLQSFDWEPWRKQPRELWPLVELVPEGPEQPPSFRTQVEELCANLPLRLVRAYWSATMTATPVSLPVHWDLEGKNAPEELFSRYYASLYNGDTPDADLLRCFREAMDSVLLEGQ